MKKRVLVYLAVITSVFSLQSCVSNYVVSNPTTYKTDAKLASISQNKLTEAKKEISPAKQINAALATLEKANTNAAIEKAILHDKKIDGLLAEADSYLGTPYRYGGMTRNGIDCSAFVLSVFGSSLGMTLPRVAASQSQQGERVSREEIQKGDLVFFSHGGGRISHVGIVHSVSPEGDIKFIHAATSRGVMVSSLTDSYWGPKFRFAKRIINEESENAYNSTLANNQ